MEIHLKVKKEYRGEAQTMSSIDTKNFIKDKKPKKSTVIATIVAGSVITVATIGLAVGVSEATQARTERNVDKLSKTNPVQLNEFDETLNSISRKVASEKKVNKEKYDLAQKVKAEEAKRKQDEAEQAKKKQADEYAAQQQAAEQAAAEQTTVEQATAPAAAPATQNVQAAQASTNEPSYYVGGYTSASSSNVQAVIDSNLMLWASISDIPTSGGVALFGHTDFAGRASAGGWIAGASVGQIVNISGANYRITSKYTVIHNSDAQYDAVTGAQPGEVIFHTCATLDQGTVWILRTQRI